MALFSIPLIFEIIFFGNRPSANGRFFPSRRATSNILASRVSTYFTIKVDFQHSPTREKSSSPVREPPGAFNLQTWTRRETRFDHPKNYDAKPSNKRKKKNLCDNISFHWEGEEEKNPSSRVYFLGLMFALLSQVRMFELMILVKSNVFVHLQWRLMVLTEKRRYGGERSYRPPTREPNYSQSVLETATLN